MKRLVLAALLGGCSFVMVKGPDPQTAPGRMPACDTDATVPIMGDVLLGIFGLIGVGAGIDDKTLSPGERGASIAVGTALVVASTASIIVGRDRTRRCRAAVADRLLTR